jgi:phosphatidylglycerol:prolipoprotein diacylglycerol transferase
MRPILFHLGDLAVPSFWVMAFLGFFAAFVVIRSDLLRRGFGADLAYDITLYAYVGGWVGARLFLIPSAWDLFTQNPFRFLVMSSGWVWYGGLIGGALAVALLARQRNIPLLVLADVVAPAAAIGLGIGRIGCQLAGDGDYGIPTTLPWGMSYPEGVVPTNERVHPTPIYEAIACFLIFAYLWRQRAQSLHPGDLTGRYFILAALVRFLVEFVRRNPAWLAGFTTAQWMSVGLALAGVVLVRHRSAADVMALSVR